MTRDYSVESVVKYQQRRLVRGADREMVCGPLYEAAGCVPTQDASDQVQKEFEMAKLSRWYGVLLIRLGSARTRHSMRSVVTVVWLAVLVLPVPQPVCADIEYRLSVAASPPAIPRDHCSTSAVMAVLTVNGQPAAGKVVKFIVSSGGEFVVSGSGTKAEQSVLTNSLGQAEVEVRSDLARDSEETAAVYVSAEGVHASVNVTLRAISVSLTKNKSKLVILEEEPEGALITAVATDSAGTPCWGSITFTTNCGNFAENGQQSCTKPLVAGRSSAVLRTGPAADTVTAEVSASIEFARTSTTILFITPGRVTVALHRRRAQADGWDSLPVVVRAYDTKGRLLSSVPVELTYSPPEPSAVQTSLWGRTGPDGAALLRLPPSHTPGLGMLQARVGKAYSNLVHVRFGPGPLPDEKEPAGRSPSKKGGKGG